MKDDTSTVKIYVHVTPALRTKTGKVLKELEVAGFENDFVNNGIRLSINQLAFDTRTKVNEIIVKAKMKAAERVSLGVGYYKQHMLSEARRDKTYGVVDEKVLLNEMHEIDTSDIVMLFVPEFKASGYLTMLGYSLAKNKQVYLFGDIDKIKFQTMFTLHSNVYMYETLDECFKQILKSKSNGTDK